MVQKIKSKPSNNKIFLSFEKAVEGLLAVKPKKATKPKKKSDKK